VQHEGPPSINGIGRFLFLKEAAAGSAPHAPEYGLSGRLEERAQPIQLTGTISSKCDFPGYRFTRDWLMLAEAFSPTPLLSPSSVRLAIRPYQ
jgi:hypothetical protein